MGWPAAYPIYFSSVDGGWTPDFGPGNGDQMQNVPSGAEVCGQLLLVELEPNGNGNLARLLS